VTPFVARGLTMPRKAIAVAEGCSGLLSRGRMEAAHLAQIAPWYAKTWDATSEVN